MDKKEETLEKIRLVLQAEEAELTAAADSIAPDFNYEEEGRRLAEEESFQLPPAQVSRSRYPRGASERYKPKTGIGRFFLRDRHRKAMGVMIILILFAGTYQCLDWFVPKTVKVIYQGFDGTYGARISTTARTASQVKDELDNTEVIKHESIKELVKGNRVPQKTVRIKADSYLINSQEQPVTNDTVIRLCAVEETEARIGGEKQSIRLIPGTVKKNLAFNGVAYDQDDEIRPALGETVGKKTEIVVDDVTYKVKEKTEKVKAEDTVILDPNMESGVQTTSRGNDGKGVFLYKTKYVNGKKTGTEKEVKKWIKKPHNHELHLGTGRTGHTGTYKIKGTFTANCSAYWMGNNCYGAGGGKCVYGTVAVDRSRYPYGTMFWIEGYGFAVANDCGTSIKGDKLDLWMDSYAESCRWGRRHMTTYILEELR